MLLDSVYLVIHFMVERLPLTNCFKPKAMLSLYLFIVCLWNFVTKILLTVYTYKEGPASFLIATTSIQPIRRAANILLYFEWYEAHSSEYDLLYHLNTYLLDRVYITALPAEFFAHVGWNVQTDWQTDNQVCALQPTFRTYAWLKTQYKILFVC